MDSTGPRVKALLDVVEFRRPLAEAVRVLGEFGWDSDVELLTVGPEHLEAAMARFIDGRLPAEDLELWANSLEVRDDIRYAPAEVNDLLVELANPTLTGVMDEDRADGLLQAIRSLRKGRM